MAFVLVPCTPSDNTNSMTDNIIDRDNLQNAYIESIIDGMDHKTMYQYVYDNLTDHLDKYSVQELVTEVEDYYPELLEESNTNWVGCLTSWIGGTQNRHSPQDRVL